MRRGFGNPELHTRVTHYDVISRITNSGFFRFFRFFIQASLLNYIHIIQIYTKYTQNTDVDKV